MLGIDFVSIKDLHLSFGFQNRIRTNYEKHITSKLEFVTGYCNANNITNIILTGDVVDSSTEDKWSFKKFIKNKRVLEKTSDYGKIDIYSNVGNHDMFHGYEGTAETIFGEMVHDGVLKNLTNHPIIKKDTKGNTIIIQGIDYSNEKNIILDKLRVLDEMDFLGQTFKVAVLHSNISPESDLMIDFTYDALAEKFIDIDMFICGHYHIGYPTATIERPNNSKPAIFVNNWNFTRVVRDYETKLDSHTPEFEHISIYFDDIKNEFVCKYKTQKVDFVKYDIAFIPNAIKMLGQLAAAESFNFFKTVNFEEVKTNSKLTDDELLEKIKETGTFKDSSYLKCLQYLNDVKK